MLKIILIFLSFINVSYATSLVNRYQYLSTAVLPDGVWTFGVSHGQSISNGNGSFSSSGIKVSNQEFFSKDITYSNLLDEIKDPLEKDLAGAAFNVYGRKDNEYAGTVVNDVDVSQKSDAYILGRGFGEKSSLFIIFPIVTVNTRFNSKFNHSPSLLNLAKQLRSEGQFTQAQDIIEKSQDALRKSLDENGYRSNYPTELTTLANIHVNHRYAAITKTDYSLSADSTVVVPAGKRFDEDDFLYYKIREEQYSFRQSVTGMINLNSRFALFASTYYHKRFSFEQRRRIPKNAASPLSDDIDQNTSIRFGDTWGGGLQLNFSPSDAYVFYVGQSLEGKLRDSVSGSRYESRRYDYMEKDTNQRLGIGYIGIAMNTVQSFIAQKFPIPIDLNLQYSFSNFGQNVFNNQAIAMNLMVFYK